MVEALSDLQVKHNKVCTIMIWVLKLENRNSSDSLRVFTRLDFSASKERECTLQIICNYYDSLTSYFTSEYWAVYSRDDEFMGHKKNI